MGLFGLKAFFSPNKNTQYYKVREGICLQVLLLVSGAQLHIYDNDSVTIL